MVPRSMASAEVIPFPRPDDTSPEWDAAVLSWEVALNRKSPSTRKVYLTTVRMLAGYLVANGFPTEPSKITPEHVRRFLGTIGTPSTARLRFQTLRLHRRRTSSIALESNSSAVTTPASRRLTSSRRWSRTPSASCFWVATR